MGALGVSSLELASFIISVAMSLVFLGFIQYMRDIAGKAEEKCKSVSSRMSVSYPDLFEKLVSCGLCIGKSRRIMEQIVRDGASYAETMKSLRDMECPSFKSEISKSTAVYAAVVAVVTVVFALSTNASFLTLVLVFIIYYSVALGSIYSNLKGDIGWLLGKLEEAERAEERLSELLEEINRKCSGGCF